MRHTDTIKEIQATSKEIKMVANNIDDMRSRGLGAWKHKASEQEVIDGIKTQVNADHLRLLADYLDGRDSDELVLKDKASDQWIRIRLLGQILGVVI